jgi:hypothetical protein
LNRDGAAFGSLKNERLCRRKSGIGVWFDIAHCALWRSARKGIESTERNFQIPCRSSKYILTSAAPEFINGTMKRNVCHWSLIATNHLKN